LSSSAHSSGR